MKTRKKIKKTLDVAAKQKPKEVEPTEEEKKAFAEGEKAYARGEYVRWRDVKTDAV